MKSVPIPGQILRTSVFLGLTFDELVLLGAVPLVVLLPGVMIEQIPLVVSLGIGGLAGLGVVVVALRSPDGQTPIEWAPAAFRRRVTPDQNYVKPRERYRDDAACLDVVQTRHLIEEGVEPEPEETLFRSQETVETGIGDLYPETDDGRDQPVGGERSDANEESDESRVRETIRARLGK